MKKLALTSLLFLCFLVFVNAQVVQRPVNLNIAKAVVPKDSSAAFRMAMLNFGGSGISFTSDASSTNKPLSLQTEFDLGENIKNQKFVAPWSAIYHFDARINFGFPISDYQKHYRWR